MNLIPMPASSSRRRGDAEASMICRLPAVDVVMSITFCYFRLVRLVHGMNGSRSALYTGETIKAVSAVVYSLYRDTPHHSEWVVACLTGAWCGILGERVAAACRPASLRDTELVVEVTDRAWFLPLSDMKDEMLRLIRTATGGAVRQLTLTKPRESQL